MAGFADKRQWGPTPRYDRVRAYEPKQKDFIVIAGPCSVESETQINYVANAVASAGATHLRGGLFRAGTYPNDNYGIVSQDLFKAFKYAAGVYQLKTVIEVLDAHSLDFVLPYADCLQVGCRQMQNYSLLTRLSRTNKTVFLKRSPGATIDEFLGSAEYLLKGGACTPVLIERGSATQATHVRWDLSISMIPAIKSISQIPVVVDAAHGTGRRDLVVPMTLAGVAAGAAGILVEVHPKPELSLSDADQAIDPNKFKELMFSVGQVRNAIRGI